MNGITYLVYKADLSATVQIMEDEKNRNSTPKREKIRTPGVTSYQRAPGKKTDRKGRRCKL